ncbi:MAG: EAL domain-containing protein [Herminiimonas sp.]|nr:EAL domain-containing protein [Herminiimonas sp.]
MIIAAPARGSHDARPLLLFFVCLTIAAIVCQTWWSIAEDRRLTIESETRNGLVAVRIFEEHATQTLRDAERSVDAVATAMQLSGDEIFSDDDALRDLLVQARRENQYLQSVRYINQDGVSWITSFHSPVRQIDVSDRQYIRYLKKNPTDRKTLIGHPLKSRYDEQWVIPLARNVFNRDGINAGVVAAYVSIRYFVNFYERASNNSRAVVSMFGDDGFLIVQSPFEDGLIDQDISQFSSIAKIRNGPIEGAFEDRSFFGAGELRLNTYRKTSGFPITVLYGRDVADILAPWQGRNADRLLSTAAIITFILILSYLLLIHIRRLRKSEASVIASETRYRMLFESANDGILLINRDYAYVDCNPAAIELFDVPDASYIVGKKIGGFSPQQQPADVPRLNQTELVDAAFGGESQLFEWATLRKGQLRYNEISLTRTNVDSNLLLCVFRDISGRKYVEALHAGQNLILHMIGTGSDLRNILTEINAFIEQRAPHARCMMILLNDDGSHFGECVATSMSGDLVSTVIGMSITPSNGSFSEAVLTTCPVMVEDIGNDAFIADMLARAGQHDVSASGTWPIMGKNGQILGIFVMLYKRCGMPSASDMQLVGISTDLASIAIESRWAEERIRHLAHYDDLTGLPNRFLYTQHLSKSLAHAERYSTPIGVLFLDLDRFKNINDTFGHEAGDKVLRDVSARFLTCLRDSDTIARVGGDEFIALVDGYHDPVQLSDIAYRLLVEATKPFEIDGQECQLSVSIGIATYPLDGSDAQVLLKNADIAMYRAKATGRNNYQFYSAEMNTHTVERLMLETRLRRAIERREFVMHYQPKVDVHTGHIVGAEALVRWKHPERGLLFPGDFIPLAEEAGLINALGLLVLDITCSDIVEFRRQSLSFGRVAINLSGNQFNEGDLLRDVMEVVDSWKVLPADLEFEITESMVMNNRDHAIRLMDDIRALGISLSIDDFGTGYSSLAYLKRFPVDSVKVDKSFINDIPGDANDSAIVQAIIVMAHTLGLKVTAEGVETLTQLEILQSFGCDEYQGFFFSRAIPARDFINLVQQQLVV